MTQDTARSTSRRTFVKCGLLSGALVGTPSSAAGLHDESGRSEETATEEMESVGWGVMRPYQYTPQAGVTVLESGLDWQPTTLQRRYRTHVLAYDHAPSFRSLLFTTADGPAVESGQSFELGREDQIGGGSDAENRDRRQTERALPTIPGRFVPVGLQLRGD